MSAKIDGDGPQTERVYVLCDYQRLTRYWQVLARGSDVLSIHPCPASEEEHADGMIAFWKMDGRQNIMGYLSTERLREAPGAPDYAASLRLLVNDRIVGDGLEYPRIQFRRGILQRHVSIETKDGWNFAAAYKAPLVREAMRRLLVGKTLEYDPVDFVESLMAVVSAKRPAWVA